MAGTARGGNEVLVQACCPGPHAPPPPSALTLPSSLRASSAPGSPGSPVTRRRTVIYSDPTPRRIRGRPSGVMCVKRAPNYRSDGSIDGPFQAVSLSHVSLSVRLPPAPSPCPPPPRWRPGSEWGMRGRQMKTSLTGGGEEGGGWGGLGFADRQRRSSHLPPNMHLHHQQLPRCVPRAGGGRSPCSHRLFCYD